MKVPTTRLYPGPDDDLITWVAGIQGQKTTEVKKVLRLGLRNSCAANKIDLDLDNFRVNLIGDFRQILEAALESVSVAAPASAEDEDEDDEVEAMLDDFDFGL